MTEFVFFVTPPKQDRALKWHFSVGSQQLKVYGPFHSYAAAIRFRSDLARRWTERAKALGGCFQEKGNGEWVVTLPEGCAIAGLKRHPEQSTFERKGSDPRDDPPLRLRPGPWKIF